MTVTINVRITDDQAKKIKKSGLDYSKYTRAAIDFYDERKVNSLLQYKLSTIQVCIDLLVAEKKEIQSQLIEESYKNLYENEKNVKKNDDENLYKNEENVKNLYKNEEKSLQDVKKNDVEILYKNEESVKKMSEDDLYYKYRPHLHLLSKMLNLHNSVPEETKKKITTETATTMSQISNFIYDYRDEIKQCEWSISSERFTSDYEDGKKM